MHGDGLKRLFNMVARHARVQGRPTSLTTSTRALDSNAFLRRKMPESPKYSGRMMRHQCLRRKAILSLLRIVFLGKEVSINDSEGVFVLFDA